MTMNLNSSELCSLEGVLDSYIAQKTAIALSSLLGEDVSHSLKATHVEPSNISRIRQFATDLVLCSVFLHGGGDIRLGILYSIPEDDGKRIAAKLLCMDKLDSLDEIGKSAISEVGNIMSGSFFNALSNHTGLKVDLSTPDFAMTSVGNLMEPHASEFLCPVDDIVTEVELVGSETGVRVHMMIIQDNDNARKLLKIKS